MPGLTKESLEQSQKLLGQHNVDGGFLDFLVSETGTQLLAAWREREGGAAKRQQDTRGKHSRQKLTTNDRRLGQHYFAASTSSPSAAASLGKADPRAEAQKNMGAANRNRVWCSGSAWGNASCTSSASDRPEVRPSDRSQGGGSAGSRANAQAGGLKLLRSAKPPRSKGANLQDRVDQSGEQVRERQEALHWYQGVVKSFSVEAGFGFIRCPDIEDDVFLHKRELPAGETPEAGWVLDFTVEYDSRKRPQSRRVSGMQAKRFVGSVKSVGDEFGFITCPEATRLYHQDVYVLRSQLTEAALSLRTVSFSVALNSKGQPQAKDIECDDDEGDHDYDATAVDEAGASDSTTKGSGKVCRW